MRLLGSWGTAARASGSTVHFGLRKARGSASPCRANLWAAKARYELTGDPGPLLLAVEADDASILVRKARVTAAKLYWQLTGETSRCSGRAGRGRRGVERVSPLPATFNV
ncbi:hypothetical protein SAMN04489726_0896 [Allokutzneria albata]|uniref:Uncharacterized protein n=1 Tax=Allokutzneria albata TaxID=211114 RepID=A0A1G9S5C4_ALLAB|nr:hypothetical protein SAMN04489726_0896 [Allokutzneria albata]